MRKDSISLLSLTAAALVFAGGCACVNNNPASAPPADRTGGAPALLEESTRYVAAAPQPCSPEKRAASEVKSELVYNLGDNVVCNTLSITMAGGYDKPRPFERPGGVDICCNPVPPRYYDTLAGNRNRPVVITAAPVHAVPEPVYPSGRRVVSSMANDVPAPAAPLAAPAPAPAPAPAIQGESRAASGSGISDAFTLTDEELKAGPEVFYPGSGQINGATERKMSEPAPEAIRLPADTGESAPSVTKDSAPEPFSSAPVAPPAEVAPLAPPADLSTPVLPSLPSDFDSAFLIDKYAASGQNHPPIPTVSDLDGAVEAMLSRDGVDSSSLPAVELPPKLN